MVSTSPLEMSVLQNVPDYIEIQFEPVRADSESAMDTAADECNKFADSDSNWTRDLEKSLYVVMLVLWAELRLPELMFMFENLLVFYS